MYIVLFKIQNRDIIFSSWESLHYPQITTLERKFIEITVVRKNILEKFHKVKQDSEAVRWINIRRTGYAEGKIWQKA